MILTAFASVARAQGEVQMAVLGSNGVVRRAGNVREVAGREWNPGDKIWGAWANGKRGPMVVVGASTEGSVFVREDRINGKLFSRRVITLEGREEETI